MTIVILSVKLISVWRIEYSNKAFKAIGKLPSDIQEIFYSLKTEMEIDGPYRSNWHNYRKFMGLNNCYHCHLHKGKPTYVACWKIIDKTNKRLEIYYVGTHEKAPY